MSYFVDNDRYRRIHFAIMAIESGARKMNISGREMHDHRHLSDPKYGLQLMSDPYILEDILVELGKS